MLQFNAFIKILVRRDIFNVNTQNHVVDTFYNTKSVYLQEISEVKINNSTTKFYRKFFLFIEVNV